MPAWSFYFFAYLGIIEERHRFVLTFLYVCRFAVIYYSFTIFNLWVDQRYAKTSTMFCYNDSTFQIITCIHCFWKLLLLLWQSSVNNLVQVFYRRLARKIGKYLGIHKHFDRKSHCGNFLICTEQPYNIIWCLPQFNKSIVIDFDHFMSDVLPVGINIRQFESIESYEQESDLPKWILK